MLSLPTDQHHGPQLRWLLAEQPRAGLAALGEAAAAVRDPWARHWLTIAGEGRPEWVLQHWARHGGIASRSQHLSVRAVVELAASGGDDQRSVPAPR